MMDRHERAGKAANIAAFVLAGCLVSGIADESLKDYSREDGEEIKQELQEIIDSLTASAQYHRRMGAAIRVRPGPKPGERKNTA